MSSEKKEKKQHKINFNIKEKLKKTFSKEHLKEVFTGEEQKKHLKQGSYSSIMTVIVLAVIVVINLIVAQIPTSKTQIDLSTQKMYSITDETKTALKDLDQDVTLYYIVQKGSEDDTIEKLLSIADGAVVGTTFKYDGKFENQTDVNRVREFMDKVKSFR